MLRDVHKIDWGDLKYPNMPDWLEGLSSPDYSVRQQALEQFYDNRVVELSDASPYVIQFLIELLTYDEVEGKEEILNILFRLADEAQTRSADCVAQKALDFIAAGTDIYTSFLQKQHLRGISLKLLGYIKQKSPVIIPKLLGMVEQSEIKAAALYSLNELLTDNSMLSDQEKFKHVEYFLNLLQHENDDYVRLAIALILSDLMKENAPKEVEFILIQALARASSEKREYAGSVHKINRAIKQLGDKKL